MQVHNINSNTNNYSLNKNQNFTAIKSVKYEGLYKNYPELATGLVETLKNNKETMSFCKKYDVDIILRAVKSACASVESSVHVLYDDVNKSKGQKLFAKLLNKPKDKVKVSAWAGENSIERSIEESTKLLKKWISPKSLTKTESVDIEGNKIAAIYEGGILDSRLKFADEKMSETLYKTTDQNRQVKNTNKLNDSINELIKESL